MKLQVGVWRSTRTPPQTKSLPPLSKFPVKSSSAWHKLPPQRYANMNPNSWNRVRCLPVRCVCVCQGGRFRESNFQGENSSMQMVRINGWGDCFEIYAQRVRCSSKEHSRKRIILRVQGLWLVRIQAVVVVDTTVLRKQVLLILVLGPSG